MLFRRKTVEEKAREARKKEEYERRHGILVSQPGKKDAGREAPPEKPKIKKGNIDYLGFKYGDPEQAVSKADANKAYGISSDERMHMAIFGLPGSGKSSILKLLAYQNIMRNEGFMVVDPHGQLARDIMSMIPKERHGDVIYVNPASLHRFGRTIKVNPLEVKNENDRYVVVMSFVSALYNLYKDTWGPRLEVILRNAANALVESPGQNTLGNISAMITDETARESILEGVRSKNVRHFWEDIYAKQYSKEAGAAAYNKIDKILATPTVAAMLDSVKSSISISDIMNNKRMLIADLSTGASDDIAQFLGSIFLNMLYVDAKRRLDVEGVDSGGINKFYVYIDEAHMFSNSTMSEMLRTVRKFNVNMALATQTCNAFESNFAKEIPGVCKTIITGRCDPNTANLLKSVMSTSVEEMQRLPSHSFAMFSDEHGVHANAVFRSRPVPFPGKKLFDWEDVAKTSVEKWGDEVDLEELTTKNDDIPFTPVEACIVHMMYFEPGDWQLKEFLERIPMVFSGIRQREITGALERLAREQYVKVIHPVEGEDTRKRYSLGNKALEGYLSRSYGGRRSGSEEHMAIISRIMGNSMSKHRYCVADLGQSGSEAPDILMVAPEVTERDGRRVYDPHKWSKKHRVAVEVEMNPEKHMDQAVSNYEKSHKKKMDVWFVCIDGHQREKLEEGIRELYPKFRGCYMDVVRLDRILKRRSAHEGLEERPGAFRTDPCDDLLYDLRFPETDDELLSDIKVMTIREVMDAAAKKDRKNPQYHGRKSDTGQVGNTGTDNQDPANDMTKTGGRFTDLEQRIVEGIKDGSIYRHDEESISRKLGSRYATGQVRDAINSLVQRRMIRSTGYAERVKFGSLDGTGDRTVTRNVRVLEMDYDGNSA